MLREIFLKRDLICQLVLRNLKVRYCRPTLGFFWAFLTPLITVGIFYLVFGLMFKVKIKEAPFLLYLMSAVFPWNFFQEAVLSSATSLVESKNLLKEGSIAHYLIPVSIILTAACNFLLPVILIIITSLFMMGGLPAWIILLPIVFLLHLIFTFGVCMFTAILYVRFRDIKHILESLLFFLFYLTPAFYSLSLVKEVFSSPVCKIYMFNPFVGLLNLYRITLIKGYLSFLQENFWIGSMLIAPLFFGFLMVAAAIFIHNKFKDRINDYLSY